MDSTIHKLLPAYRRARAEGAAVVLATIVATRGSTYRKPGAQMLFAGDRGATGMLSGGCLEADIGARAQRVLASGQPELFCYDGTAEGDALWGLDSGCPGAMDVWLVRVDAATGWEPLASVERAAERGESIRYGLVLESRLASLRPGTVVVAPVGAASAAEGIGRWLDETLAANAGARSGCVVRAPDGELALFVAAVASVPSLLVSGAGDDAIPLTRYADMLGWAVTVVDSRSAYLQPGRFPAAARLVCASGPELGQALDVRSFDAAVVMNHRLSSDVAMLEHLARSAVPFVGLLGPPARRDAVLQGLGGTAELLHGRLRAPVGLNLGGRDEASVALAIAAELQAFFAARAAGSV